MDDDYCAAGEICTVFSTKGGVGGTFVATNLAIALSKQQDVKVVIVDLDLNYGGVSEVLDVEPLLSVSDILDEMDDMNEELMSGYLTTHESGLKVLASSSITNLDRTFEAEQVFDLLELLQDMFDYIIIDTPSIFTDLISPAIALSKAVFLITTPEILALKNVKHALGVFERLNYPSQDLKIILNKMTRNDITVRNIEKTLNKTVDVIISDDSKKVRHSQNTGRPYMMHYSRGSIIESFQNMTELFLNCKDENDYDDYDDE